MPAIDVVEFPEPSKALVASRRSEYRDAIKLTRPMVEELLTARGTILEANIRTVGMRGGFSPRALQTILFARRTDVPSPKGVHPQTPYEVLPQHGVHPLKRWYPFPAVWCHIKTHILRRLRLEEREAIVMHILSDLAKEGKLKKTEKRKGFTFVVLSPHVEEAPPPGPSGPLAPAHLEALQEP